MIHKKQITRTQSGVTLIEFIVMIAMLVVAILVIKGCFFGGGSNKNKDGSRSSDDELVYLQPNDVCGVRPNV